MKSTRSKVNSVARGVEASNALTKSQAQEAQIAADLKGGNTAVRTVGGTTAYADSKVKVTASGQQGTDAAQANESASRKKKPGGLASQLGINV